VPMTSSIDSDPAIRSHRPDPRQTVQTLLDSTDQSLRRGARPGAHVWPTGFDLLDSTLDGGLRSGDHFRLAAKMTSAMRKSAFPRMVAANGAFVVTVRSPFLSTEELAAQLAKTQTDLQALATFVTTYQGQNSADLAQLRSLIAAVRIDLDGLRGDFTGMQGSIASLSVALDAAKLDLNARIDLLGATDHPGLLVTLSPATHG